jgi:hypothetical protein
LYGVLGILYCLEPVFMRLLSLTTIIKDCRAINKANKKNKIRRPNAKIYQVVKISLFVENKKETA